MKYYELTVTAYLKKDLYFTETNSCLSKVINKAMAMDKHLLEKHLNTGYKHYVFSGLLPIERDKYYKEGKVYIFRIHTLDSYLAEEFQNSLTQVNDKNIKIISVQKRQFNKRHINHIYTATPAVATVNHQYWTLGDDILLLQERIQNNLEKKYKTFYKRDIKVESLFMANIEILNRKPILYKYKSTSIIGNRLRIHVNPDDVSQILSFIAIACGILEKNSSLGMGFCLAK